MRSVETLTEHMEQLVGGGGGDADPSSPERYVEAAEALLAPLLANEGEMSRAQAMDLLVADALVTAAFEKAGDDMTRVDAYAAWAMRRLAALGAL